MYPILGIFYNCGFLSPRATAFLVSIISLGGCLADSKFVEDHRRSLYPCMSLTEKVQSARCLLLRLFQVANVLLLLATTIESSCLVQIYLWYTLGFVVMGLMVALLEFLLHSQEDGPSKSLVLFIPDVTFLFVLSQCLPLIDQYRQQLTMHTVAADLRTSQYSYGIPEFSGLKMLKF